ncbi:unnamed protein product [Paramecium octaurelia]|uniref:Uncharacterized protein n=1 Tax=Paramecium octaurelia TaxID=43137 RepID=A0A8S1Y5B5_PAROT|nr:unnamed protein product [Paramecium octaurelia]
MFLGESHLVWIHKIIVEFLTSLQIALFHEFFQMTLYHLKSHVVNLGYLRCNFIQGHQSLCQAISILLPFVNTKQSDGPQACCGAEYISNRAVSQVHRIMILAQLVILHIHSKI